MRPGNGEAYRSGGNGDGGRVVEGEGRVAPESPREKVKGMR